MSVEYKAIGWNPQKKVYDTAIVALVLAYLGAFVGLGAWVHPNATVETLLIRGLGTLAFLMLNVILAIGPLCRLDRRFLPLLYNRRHLGVAMFAVALAHGVFSLIQFHALGDTNLLISLFASNTRFRSVAEFPFELLGVAALAILFLMAATSHDFWLHNLTPGVWKRLHMSVYAAYLLLVAHVCLGALQSETSPTLAVTLAIGAVVLSALHLLAGLRERDRVTQVTEGFTEIGALESIPDSRARIVALGAERVAVFRRGTKVSALSNVCRHQGGPLGEGRIVDGCVTCPWHGYQYDPDTGVSPPPYDDRVAVFPVKVLDGQVWVQACPK